jgi:hypothetical protein
LGHESRICDEQVHPAAAEDRERFRGQKMRGSEKRAFFRRPSGRVAIIGVLLLVETVFVGVPPAMAQATRTWVSGVGDDANPCSRTAPCKTWAGAISKTATGGEINALDPGGFGALTITKSITIDGGGHIASTLSVGVPGFIINAASAKVVLRNIQINGTTGATQGTLGIRALAFTSLHVENVQISGFSQNGIIVDVTGANQRVSIKDTSITETGGGILFKAPNGGAYSAHVERTHLFNNTFGLRSESNTTVSVRDSVAANNTNNGFNAAGVASPAGPVKLFLESCIAANNGVTGVASNSVAGSPTTVWISNLASTGNANGILAGGGGSIISAKNNTVLNNGTDGSPTSSVAQI